jgi:hypothetical protein
LAWIAVQLGRHKWQPTWLFPGFAVLLLVGFVKESFIPVLPGVLVFIHIVMPLTLSSQFAQILSGFKNYGRVSAAEEVHHGRDAEDHQ